MFVFQVTTNLQPFAGIQLKSSNFEGQARLYDVSNFTLKGMGTSVDRSKKFEISGSVKLNNAKFNLAGEADLGKQNTYKIKAGSGQTFSLSTIASETLKLNAVAIEQLEAKFSPKSPAFQTKLGGGLQLTNSDFSATVTFVKPLNMKGSQPNEFLSNAETATNIRLNLANIAIEGQAKFVGLGSNKPLYTEYKIGIIVPFSF